MRANLTNNDRLARICAPGVAMFQRDLEKTLLRFAKFPVVALLGPRQSGKTTLAKATFNNHHFVSLENPQQRSFALEDPQGFLKKIENPVGIIIDEFQYAPELLSYIQVEADEKKRPGYFIITGSHNFLMNQAITQSLAGRVGILTLLPLSLHEILNNKLVKNLNEAIFNGGYPRLYSESFSPLELLPSYIHSYIERDVRQFANIGDIHTFQKFMQMCAARVGQQLNITDIATNCGVDSRTINKWLSVLEASYIIFLLKPHFNNFNKRITKTSKLYFYDTGLACSLLEMSSPDNLSLSSFRGALFECLILSDFYKQYHNSGLRPALYYWRDQNGILEIDGLVDLGVTMVPVEIKSGETITKDFFKGLKRWCELASVDPSNGYVIYGGDDEQKRSMGHVLSWQQTGTLISHLKKQ